jgi:hypothetical protein
LARFFEHAFGTFFLMHARQIALGGTVCPSPHCASIEWAQSTSTRPSARVALSLSSSALGIDVFRVACDVRMHKIAPKM